VARYPPNALQPRPALIPASSDFIPADVLDSDESWGSILAVSNNGKPDRILSNVMFALELSARWKGAFAYDEFALRPVTTRDLLGGRIVAGAAIQDHQISLITTAIQAGDGICVPSNLVVEAIVTVAKSNLIHPVRDYLNPSIGTDNHG
jgi:predicted P-loop ATPase